MDFGSAVREARKKQKWSQQELADRSGVSRQAVNGLEQNRGRVSTFRSVEPLLNFKIVGLEPGEHIGERIRATRMKRRVSQAELAEASGMSANTVRALESGGGLVERLSCLVPHASRSARIVVEDEERRQGSNRRKPRPFTPKPSSHGHLQVEIGNATLFLGDAADVIGGLPLIDAVITDGPYGLSFMSKGWDYAVPRASFWSLCAERMKPGAHLLNFASARTYHRMAVEVEDAGLEIRDQILWLNGEGFPKTHDVSHGIDKHFGHDRPKLEMQNRLGFNKLQERHGVQTVNVTHFERHDGLAVTPEAARWQGWGNALKPAHEPCVLARKPMAGSVAANLIAHGVGALNIDACRVPGDVSPPSELGEGVQRSEGSPTRTGRYPANLIHDGSEAVVALFPVTTTGIGTRHARGENTIYSGSFGGKAHSEDLSPNGGDTGSAARYFYCAKASVKERDEGLEIWRQRSPAVVEPASFPDDGSSAKHDRVNHHATVKPIKLMEQLCKLVTPPGGLILDPFLGSGTTGVAAVRNGFRFVGVEVDVESFTVAAARIAHAQSIAVPDEVLALRAAMDL